MKLVQLRALMDHAKEDLMNSNVLLRISVELVVLLRNMEENVSVYLLSLMSLSLNTVELIIMFIILNPKSIEEAQ